MLYNSTFKNAESLLYHEISYNGIYEAVGWLSEIAEVDSCYFRCRYSEQDFHSSAPYH
jgi:hypothetical protein